MVVDREMYGKPTTHRYTRNYSNGKTQPIATAMGENPIEHNVRSQIQGKSIPICFYCYQQTRLKQNICLHTNLSKEELKKKFLDIVFCIVATSSHSLPSLSETIEETSMGGQSKELSDNAQAFISTIHTR